MPWKSKIVVQQQLHKCSLPNRINTRVDRNSSIASYFNSGFLLSESNGWDYILEADVEKGAVWECKLCEKQWICVEAGSCVRAEAEGQLAYPGRDPVWELAPGQEE